MAPTDCLIGRENRSAKAWVVSSDGSRSLLRSIELGSLQLDGYIDVRSGLLAGELLIQPPYDGLEEGRRIKVSTASP